MPIIAKYTGENCSMGFKKNSIYKLNTKISFNSANKGFFTIYDTKSGIFCPYSSLEVFLKYWEIIGLEQKPMKKINIWNVKGYSGFWDCDGKQDYNLDYDFAISDVFSKEEIIELLTIKHENRVVELELNLIRTEKLE